ncbi:hypothetical protein FC83_GL000937 [Agrilactobacillus composti DSM 18527 = JCM 14202]|uniref:Phage protein n=1 Tax=Agrilactobacillus composti DSM 18527 = JCM 14202 TaxID=1423734 RepID=X0PUR3_9LACO|nr:ATP-binding protein [Agrilactobacillus composti]KRM35633.1 hypothetical protein FC83_GL000937 [Agrilactobacillus composti DSM 18527 = JCM 14202]GAF41151.1 hypothetical protein JCM14202_3076 [Agrilactobacillus composti DSM 18527 = JCM 14202]
MNITRGIIPKAKKVVIYGPEGIGKSTLAAKFPEPLFSDTEDSTTSMDVARFDKPTSWTMLFQQADYVIANHPCKTYVIDTADWAEKLAKDYVIGKGNNIHSIEDFGYGKGYTMLAEEWGRLLNKLSDVADQGINVVVTAHAMMRKFEQPDELGAYDRWELKLEKKTAPMTKEWADMVLFANYKTLVVNVDGQGASKGKNKAQGGKRVIYTQHHPSWDAKNRYNLPEEIEMDYNEIKAIIESNQPASTPQPQPTPAPVTTPPVAEAQPEAPKEDPFKDKQIEGEIKVTDDDMPFDMTDDKQPQNPQVQPENIPKPLQDLMAANGVSAEEIMTAVNQKGYYPAGTPISNYDPAFIQGVLVGAWEQVFEMIKANRQ